MKRPNIVLIWTDEQRADTMACYGNDHVKTPHLNRLASESVVFNTAYCAQPLCTPSRASILTGRWPHQHGCIRNNTALARDVPTVAEMLPKEYLSAYYGKWHLGDEVVAQRGFTEWCSFEEEYRPYYSKPEYLDTMSDYHHFLLENGFRPDKTAADGARIFSRGFSAVMAERYTKASFIGREAARFIRDRSAARSTQPFFLSVNMLEPHMPFFGPLNDVYDPDALPVGPTFAQKPGENAPWRNRFLADRYEADGHSCYPLKTEDDWRRLRANYYGLVSLVDSAVGTILDSIADAGVENDTIVVFTSDHGEMMGDHGLLAKTVMYEESIRIPLLVRVPGAAPRVVDGRVSQIDLLPTLFELAGAPVPEHLSGRSRAGVIHGTDDLGANDAVVEWNPAIASDEGDTATGDGADRLARQTWRTVISPDGYKLNLTRDDTCELYDLNADPYEQKNLYDDADRRAVRDRLTERLHAWQAQNADAADVG